MSSKGALRGSRSSVSENNGSLVRRSTRSHSYRKGEAQLRAETKTLRNAIAERSNAAASVGRRKGGWKRQRGGSAEMWTGHKSARYSTLSERIYSLAGAALPTLINWCQCTYAVPARYTSEYYAHSAPPPPSSSSSSILGRQGGSGRQGEGNARGNGRRVAERRPRTYTSRTTTPRLCRIEHN